MQGTFTTGCLGQPIMTKPKKHYVVWAGRVPGVFQTWDDCKAQVDGFYVDLSACNAQAGAPAGQGA